MKNIFQAGRKAKFLRGNVLPVPKERGQGSRDTVSWGAQKTPLGGRWDPQQAGHWGHAEAAEGTNDFLLF